METGNFAKRFLRSLEVFVFFKSVLSAFSPNILAHLKDISEGSLHFFPDPCDWFCFATSMSCLLQPNITSTSDLTALCVAWFYSLEMEKRLICSHFFFFLFVIFQKFP